MALWYRDGTVTLTNGSAFVTGSGTSFLRNVNPGYGFVSLDGRVYEVKQAVSNSSIELEEAYIGASQSGQAYAIFPTQGLAQAWVDQAIDLIHRIDGYTNTSLAGRFAAGTAGAPGVSFETDPDTGLFLDAPNDLGVSVGGAARTRLSSTRYQINVPVTGSAAQSSDLDATAGRLLKVGAFGLGVTGTPSTLADLDSITIPGGVYRVANTTAGTKPAGASPYAVSAVDRYGPDGYRQTYEHILDGRMWVRRGNTSQSPVISPWSEVFHQQSILRPVSQTAGVPVGGLFETDSGVNGEYARQADGVQICTHKLTLTYASALILAGTWTYPAQFVSGSTPNITGTVLANDFAANVTGATLHEVGSVLANIPGRVTTLVQLRTVAGATFTSGDQTTVHIEAKGRWF